MKKRKVELQGEFQKIKLATFDGEAKEITEGWIISMNKYFQVYEYNNKLKARFSIYFRDFVGNLLRKYLIPSQITRRDNAKSDKKELQSSAKEFMFRYWRLPRSKHLWATSPPSSYPSPLLQCSPFSSPQDTARLGDCVV